MALMSLTFTFKQLDVLNWSASQKRFRISVLMLQQELSSKSGDVCGIRCSIRGNTESSCISIGNIHKPIAVLKVST